MTTRVLNIDGFPFEVKSRFATGAGPHTAKRLWCGHEITVSGDVFYEAEDGRTFCIVCVFGWEER